MHKRTYRRTTILATIGVAVAFGGCGGSSATTPIASGPAGAQSQTTQAASGMTPTATASSEKVPDIDLPLTSPIASTGPLPPRYTCAGTDTSPPLSWSDIPRNTVEIDVFIVRDEHGKESTAWAVAGLKPSVRSLAAGRLPSGVILGRNEFGQNRYSVCPSPRTPSSYVVLVDALSHRLPVNPGFDSGVVTRDAVTTAEHEGELTLASYEHS